MVDTSKIKQPSRRDVAYYRQRQKNRVFAALAKFFAEEAAQGNISKKELAARMAKDPSQITRLLSAPSNLELDTVSDFLLAMGAEMDHRIVRFSERAKPNYAHPLIASFTSLYQLPTSVSFAQAAPVPTTSAAKLSVQKEIQVNRPGVTARVMG